jgi:hypothetical protein
MVSRYYGDPIREGLRSGFTADAPAEAPQGSMTLRRLRARLIHFLERRRPL